jgi:hypothetical protein
MPPSIHINRLAKNESMEEEMRQLFARSDTMETVQRRVPNVGDIIESENKDVEA